MGGFVPAAALSAVQMSISAAQQERQADAARGAAKAEARSKIAQINAAKAAEDRLRNERLRRAQASQRAQFGSAGIASGGSAQAVLAGLSKEAALTAAEQNRLNALRIGQINQQLDWQRRKNLLELSNYKSTAAFDLMKQSASNANLLSN
ncbi:MAG: hypothetical protein JNM75_08890 [Rhodospirillales bacterium]|nr:hypothetical protein [Rhodospirillales bacterium]